MEELVERLRLIGVRSGLDGFGICDADPFPDVEATLVARSEEGLAGKLTFTFSDPSRATDVRRSYAWAKRLVVGGRAYLPEAGSPGPADGATGRVARFATADHYGPLRDGLRPVADALRAEGFEAEMLVDDNRLVDRAAAVRAGVGWWGKNTMVLAPKVGPWMLIGSIVTDAELPVNAPMARNCGSCTACLPACPTGALVAPGVLDATRCLAYWAQVPGVIPRRFRSPMGDRVYGCDDCLDACPPGARLLEMPANRSAGRVDLAWMLTAGDRDLLARFAHFYIPRRDPDYLRRNALVAVGNSGSAGFLPLVEPYLTHRNWILRAHAVWAWAALGGDPAVLDERATVEERSEVIDELRAVAALP